MSLNKNKNKNKNKSPGQSRAEFPIAGWRTDLAGFIEMPNFFANPGWREIAPVPPPGPEETAKELAELLKKQDDKIELAARREEIIQEASDEDPPTMTRLLTLSARPATATLMHAMFSLGTVLGMHHKHRFLRARPHQLEPRLRPLIDVPAHPAYPSNHSLQHFLVAKALATVVQSHELGEELLKCAARIAENREYAGVHYKSDTDAGKWLAFNIFPLVVDAYSETFKLATREWL